MKKFLVLMSFVLPLTMLAQTRPMPKNLMVKQFQKMKI